jgi:NitT/TauT family transport system ATP-binding protein
VRSYGALTVTDLVTTHPGQGPVSDGRRAAVAVAPEVVVRGVSRVFSTKKGLARPALAQVDLTVPSGQFLSIIGPSGCGKSTLLRLLGGLDEPTEGTIAIGGENPRTVKGRGVIGLVPQSPALLPWKSVADNVALLDTLGPGRRPRLSRADVELWLERVELGGEGSLLPHQLSGGMQQRVALARAFAIQPSLLLMDEPFNALDEITRHHMQTLLTDLWRLTRPTVVFVTHSIDEAVKLSDRVVMLGDSPGRVTADLAIDLERPRESGIEDTPDFRQHAARIRKALIGDTNGNGIDAGAPLPASGTDGGPDGGRA